MSVAALKTSAASSAAGSIQTITTGVNDALPTATNIVGKLADLKAELGSPYRMGSRWQISRAVESLLHKAKTAAAGDWYFDPVNGIMKLLGYPVDINDHIDDGTGANEIAVYFGNFRRGLILAEHRMLTIANEYRETRPGACTFFSQGRTAGHVWDGAAVVALLEGT